ncbi:prolyl oligopeptidase family serine peptidase [Solitalea sp. MAHUQ-68]|uniref:prolyl oligopeptidase n=1 Tax=Solitalea agri TaxID=2953739 RepID=A0A9X2F240_9SPHI|nr:prolyl oligopeptidase family serine peptidase [Solitalea agri]MCO4292785.1 prolyl oligopeptidase family serine peptidase [Solitalea agri]
MKKHYLLLMALIAGISANAQQKNMIKYPDTKKDNTTDNYFGTTIADPYRWLENDTAADVKEWVKAENQVTQGYLSQIPYRDKIKQRLTELWNYPKYSAPFKKGDNYFFYKNDGLQNQAVLYYQKGLTGTPKVFLDPNKLSADGTVALNNINFSKDNKYAAIGTTASGSDWVEIKVIDVATQQPTGDVIKWVKFSGANWCKDGFYYSRYDEPVAGKEFSNQNQFQKIYYHKMGTPQSADELIYQDKDHPLRYFGAGVTEDERFLIVVSSEGTHGTEVYWKDLTKGGDFKLLFKGFEFDYDVIDNDGDRLLVLTNNNASNFRVISVDPNNPDQANWKEIIPQSKDLLNGASTGGGKLFTSYLKDASTRLYEHELNGKLVREIKLEGIGTASLPSGKKEDNEFFYTFSSFTNPGTIYRYEIGSGKSTVFRKTEINFNTADYETKQVFYTSKDGTKVPMFIVHKKGLKLDGSNPTYLYAYGGFNISLTPSFSVSRLILLENGGVFALANLRGGGEYGEDWHKGGMMEKKQNVFDDYIAAGEYLIKEKYTSSSRLAIAGGSNGGLLVGACEVQRPDLFKVAFPAVGVLDMLRYHKFTIGWGWAVEYGSSDKKEQFDYLIKYSPLHTIKPGINYPATMIITADHDDRVVPAHSFKFAATLQEKHSGDNPILIRIESKAGHGAGKPTSKIIEEATDQWSFMFWNMGFTPKY